MKCKKIVLTARERGGQIDLRLLLSGIDQKTVAPVPNHADAAHQSEERGAQ